MTLSPWTGAAGMIMAYQVPIANTDIYKCSSLPPSPRPLGTGMHVQTLLSLLLKVPRMVLLSSLLWWKLGTSLPGPAPGEWLSFWRVTSKQFWFWFWPSGFKGDVWNCGRQRTTDDGCMRAGAWKNVSYVICEQQRRRSACASAQSDQRLFCSLPR